MASRPLPIALSRRSTAPSPRRKRISRRCSARRAASRNTDSLRARGFEMDIDAEINRLREAIANNDETVGQQAALALLADFLKNFKRIADALETIASPAKP